MAALCGRLGHSDGSGGRSTGTCEIRSIRWRRQNAQQMSLPTTDRENQKHFVRTGKAEYIQTYNYNANHQCGYDRKLWYWCEIFTQSFTWLRDPSTCLETIMTAGLIPGQRLGEGARAGEPRPAETEAEWETRGTILPCSPAPALSPSAKV